MHEALRQRLIGEVAAVEDEARARLQAALADGDDDAAIDYAALVARCCQARAFVLRLLSTEEDAKPASAGIEGGAKWHP